MLGQRNDQTGEPVMPRVPAPRAAEIAGENERTIVIGHHVSLVREGLRHVVDAELPGCSVIETERMAPTVALLRTVPAEMLLLALELPGMDASSSLHTLRCLYPRLIIGVIAEAVDRRMFAQCVSTGINGFLHIHDPVEEVSHAITTMLSGRIYITPAMAMDMGQVVRKRLAPPKPSRLTPRQQEVLHLLEQGAANKEIARTLSLSESTVKIHLAAIYRMLGVRNRTEAVVNAGRERP
jgi:DNA-binding NarL/FixJ family response regulator